MGFLAYSVLLFCFIRSKNMICLTCLDFWMEEDFVPTSLTSELTCFDSLVLLGLQAGEAPWLLMTGLEAMHVQSSFRVSLMSLLSVLGMESRK